MYTLVLFFSSFCLSVLLQPPDQHHLKECSTSRSGMFNHPKHTSIYLTTTENRLITLSSKCLPHPATNHLPSLHLPPQPPHPPQHRHPQTQTQTPTPQPTQRISPAPADSSPRSRQTKSTRFPSLKAGAFLLSRNWRRGGRIRVQMRRSL